MDSKKFFGGLLETMEKALASVG
ncbi:hypothetical protein LCGC14_2254550, partial [marine sediment metagenome]